MITIEKLKIYKIYSDIGSSYNHPKRKHKKILDYHEYIVIDNLVNDLKVIQRGLAALSYANQINNKINENCDSAEEANYQREIAVIK
jgi:hypothetical protein